MRGETGEDIRPRIHQTLPVELAYRVIFAVQAAVTSEMAFLDVASVPSSTATFRKRRFTGLSFREPTIHPGK